MQYDSADYPPEIPAHICDTFEELALQVYERGFDRYSARAILHRIRWHYQIERGDIHFKVNNNYSARLARWFLKHYPSLDGFFETREGAETQHNIHGLRPNDHIGA
jgi:hypothetical protein